MKERLKTLASNLKDCGIEVAHYKQTSLSLEQYLFYFMIDDRNYTILSLTFDSYFINVEDSFRFTALERSEHRFINRFIQFETFFENLSYEHKAIFCFYLDLFDSKHRHAYL
jgi:hypothetical protein